MRMSPVPGELKTAELPTQCTDLSLVCPCSLPYVCISCVSISISIVYHTRAHTHTHTHECERVRVRTYMGHMMGMTAQLIDSIRLNMSWSMVSAAAAHPFIDLQMFRTKFIMEVINFQRRIPVTNSKIIY